MRLPGRAVLKFVATLLIAALVASACSSSTPSESAARAPSTPAPTPAPASTNEAVPDDAAETARVNDGISASDAGDTPDAGDVDELDEAAADLIGTPGAAGVGDPYYPGLGNGGYDVADYLIQATWNPVGNHLVSTTTITATATQDLATFNLDLQGLEILTLRVDGTEAGFSRDGNELTVIPDSPIADGSEFVVAVTYQGSPEKIPPMNFFDIGGWLTTDWGAYVAGEPSGSMSWHPVNDHPTDRARFRIEMTVPDPLEVVSNGSLVSQTAADGATTFIYETRDEQAPYLTVLAIGDFEFVDAGEAAGVPIRNWFATERLDSQPLFDRTPEMMEFFSEVFGPYPFEAYGVLAIDDNFGGALETQTLSIFGGDFLDPSRNIDATVAHELAHQWFGDHIALAQWNDIWLNEGFATYSEHLFFEANNPGYDIDAELAAIARLPQNLLADPVPGDPGGENLFAPSVYLRGALTLHALRNELGDETFFELLLTYVDRFGGQNVVTADFINLAEEIGDRQLDDFFQAWLYEEELPAS